MKKLFLLLFIFFYSQNTFSQNVSNKLIQEYEDTLKIIAEQIMFAKKENDRINANNGFITILKEVLSFDKSYKYPFDSLQTLSILSPEDNSFRIFNWILRKDNGTYDYFCIIHYNNKKKKMVITLI